MREMSTLSTVLDHLALGRVGQAADVITQRLKAVEVADKEGHWSRATFVELVPEDHATLVPRDEHHLMQKEAGLHKNLYQKNSYKPDFSNSGKGKDKEHKGGHAWVPKGHGKNKNKHKGKGKGKPAEKAE